MPSRIRFVPVQAPVAAADCVLSSSTTTCTHASPEHSLEYRPELHRLRRVRRHIRIGPIDLWVNREVVGNGPYARDAFGHTFGGPLPGVALDYAGEGHDTVVDGDVDRAVLHFGSPIELLKYGVPEVRVCGRQAGRRHVCTPQSWECQVR